MTLPTPSLNRTIGRRLHKLTFMMDRLAEQALRQDADLTFGEFRLLMALRRHGSLSQKAVAKFHGLTEAAVSRKITDLVQRKLILRAINPVNRREHLLGLTAAGEKLVLKAHAVLDKNMAGIFSAVSKKDIATFERTLDTLLTSIWDDGKRMHCGRPQPLQK